MSFFPLALGSSMLAVVAAATVGLNAQGPTLRQPQQSVFSAFPDADGYQAIVRNIDTTARRNIEANLPFRVHFNEIGEHTVYVALRGRLPLGIVYLLQEEDTFGLTEVEWAITLDMRLSGFRCQRTRSYHRQALAGSEFVRLLIGRSATELAALLDPDGRLLGSVSGVPAGGEESAAALVRSSLKALGVVDEVWGTEIDKLHDLALGQPSFPTAQRFLRLWPPARTAKAEQQTADSTTPKAEESTAVLVAVRAFGSQSRALGVVAKVTAPPTAVVVTWIVDDAGIVVAARAPVTAPAALRAECLDATGKPLGDAATLGGLLGKSAAELAALLHPAARPGR